MSKVGTEIFGQKYDFFGNQLPYLPVSVLRQLLEVLEVALNKFSGRHYTADVTDDHGSYFSGEQTF